MKREMSNTKTIPIKSGNTVHFKMTKLKNIESTFSFEVEDGLVPMKDFHTLKYWEDTPGGW